jgi:hypothetical protein
VGGAELGASMTSYIITYTLLLAAYVVVLTHLAGKGASSTAASGSPLAGVAA